jgi:hypothetical protein
MLDVLSAMGLLLSGWFLLFVLFSSIGSIVRSHFGLKSAYVEDWFLSFWMGWACSIMFLQIWHLWWPVDWRAFLPIFIIGIVGFFWNWYSIGYIINKAFFKEWPFYGLVLLIALWLANQSLGQPEHMDMVRYQVNTVRWISTYPIIPGLGNLYGPFAENHASFLYDALLDTGPWHHKAQHLANPLLLMVLLAHIGLSISKVLRTSSTSRIYHLFLVLLLLSAVSWYRVANFSPDFPVYALGIIISSQLLLTLLKTSWNRLESGYRIFFITTLSAVGVTVQSTFLFFGLTATIIAWVIWFVRYPREERHETGKLLVWTASISGIILVPWIIRGILLSGYIVYPNPDFSVPVDWRMPRAYVAYEFEMLRSWTQYPEKWLSTDTPGQLQGWFKSWVGQIGTQPATILDIVVPALLTVVAVVLAFLAAGGQQNVPSSLWLLLLPPLIWLACWFFLGFAPHLAKTSLWILAVGAFILALSRFSEPQIFKMARTALFLSLFFSASYLGYSLLVQGPFVLEAGEPDWFHTNPSASVVPFVTNSGLTVYVPENQACWDTQLLCTMHPNPYLHLREEGNIRAGFATYALPEDWFPPHLYLARHETRQFETK